MKRILAGLVVVVMMAAAAVAGPFEDGVAAYQRGDYVEAAKWYRLGANPGIAEQGNDKAQMSIGVAYVKGEGVPQDFVLAHMWFNLSAAHGNKSAVTFATRPPRR